MVTSLSLTPIVPCGPGCAFAELLPMPAADWVWCHHPAAPARLIHADRECRRFVARNGLPGGQRPGHLPSANDSRGV